MADSLTTGRLIDNIEAFPSMSALDRHEYRERIERLKTRLRERKKEIADLKATIEEMKSAHETKIKEMESKHRTEIGNLIASHAHRINTAGRRQAQMNRLESVRRQHLSNVGLRGGTRRRRRRRSRR